MTNKVIVIAGPTCSGKTSLSLKTARQLNTEIISADSRQVYKYLDIGTAKPVKEELYSVKHHFIDLLLPDEPFDVKMFEKGALKIIKELHGQNKVPVVVGGSGLYIRALVDGIFEIEGSTDEEIRLRLREKAETEGNEAIYKELEIVDPVSASRMLPQNYKRVIRALEVFYSTGKPIWQLQQEHKRETNIEFVQYAINWDRKELYRNIEHRVDQMINAGLVDEVARVLSMGYDKSNNSLNTVGYNEIIAYLEGTITLRNSIDLIKRNTRHYAKRQLTWFRADDRIKWIEYGKDIV